MTFPLGIGVGLVTSLAAEGNRTECGNCDVSETRFFSANDGFPVAWKEVQDDVFMLELLAGLLLLLRHPHLKVANLCLVMNIVMR